MLICYKFIFVFENLYCLDYVIEKYWYMLFDYDIVLVVFGGVLYDQKIVIFGFFINVLDFVLIKILVDYLFFLDRNENVYNEYFLWRKCYKLVFFELWICYMCVVFNNILILFKVYKNFEDFWGERSDCVIKERRIRKLVEKMD